MVIDGNQIYCGDHFVMYRNIKSLCGVPGTNMVQVNSTSKTDKQTHRKRDQICITRGWEKGKLDEGGQKGTDFQL